MSHVATVELEVKDLECLAAAARRLGLEFRRDQKTYKWWGDHVGDYPIPEGFTVEDLGKCDHAIGWPADVVDSDDPYMWFEIGLCRRKDASGRELPGYALLWDFMDSELVAKVGQGAKLLKQTYALEVTLKHARVQGFMPSIATRADGGLRVVLGKM